MSKLPVGGSRRKALSDWGWSYIENRLPVLLLKPRAKRPVAGPDGSWVVFGEHEELEEALQRHGDANLGFTLGPEKDSPVLAVDIDGPAGMEKARELGVSSRDAVWIARTGRGNWHAVYAYPDEQKLIRSVQPEDLPLDLLTNGYLVVEPSITDGPYQWQNGHSPRDISVSELFPPPTALIEWWLTAPARAGDGRSGWQPEELDQALKGVAPGQRDLTGYRLACRYLSRGLQPDEVEDFLFLWAQKCHPPIGSTPDDRRQPEVWAKEKVKSALNAFRSGKLQRRERREHRPHPGRIPDIVV